MKINQLILGSTSRFRASLLRQCGIVSFLQLASQNDETDIVDNCPKRLARARARHKAEGIQAPPCSLIIAADQVLEFEGESYGKAHSKHEAFARLRKFSGSSHFLHSAYTIAYNDLDEAQHHLMTSSVTATMVMRSL